MTVQQVIENTEMANSKRWRLNQYLTTIAEHGIELKTIVDHQGNALAIAEWNIDAALYRVLGRPTSRDYREYMQRLGEQLSTMDREWKRSRA